MGFLADAINAGKGDAAALARMEARNAPAPADPIYTDAAKSLPGAMGWAARFSDKIAAGYANLLTTPEGQTEIVRMSQQDGGLGSGGGILDRIVDETVGRDWFPTLVKGVIAVGGGIAGKVAVTGMAATQEQAPASFTSAEEAVQTVQAIQRLDAQAAAAPPPQGAQSMFDDFDWGGLLGGVGTLAQNVLTARLQQRAAAPMQVAAPALTATPVAFPSLPAITGMFGAAGTAVRAAAGILRSAGGKILRVVLPSGVKVSRAAAIKLTKAVGYTSAAAALGITVQDLAEWVMQGERKRGKGVTAAQLKTTKRTMTVVEKMHRQIAGYCRDAGVQRTRFVKVPTPVGKRCR
jgi:hypothetical protein